MGDDRGTVTTAIDPGTYEVETREWSGPPMDQYTLVLRARTPFYLIRVELRNSRSSPDSPWSRVKYEFEYSPQGE